MSDFLDKLTSYNLFNYLVPGVVFCVMADRLTTYNLLLENVVVGVFFYYFVGLVVSRIGSLIVEPAMKKLGALKFAPYDEFVAASKADPKVDVLSEVNNTYRAFSALFLTLAIFIGTARVVPACPRLEPWIPFLMVGALFLLFAFSYAKQTRYVVNRIEANIK